MTLTKVATVDVHSVVKVGQRVVLTETVDNYPTVMVEAGETGTVAEITSECVMITLDVHHEHLNEWDNQLEVYLYDDNVEVPFAIVS